MHILFLPKYSRGIFLGGLLFLSSGTAAVDPTGTAETWQLTAIINHLVTQIEQLKEGLETAQRSLSVDEYMQRQKERESVRQLSGLGGSLQDLARVSRETRFVAQQLIDDPLDLEGIERDVRDMEYQYEKALAADDLDAVARWGKLLGNMERYRWLLAGVESNVKDEQDQDTAIKNTEENTAATAIMMGEMLKRIQEEEATLFRREEINRIDGAKEGRAYECFLLGQTKGLSEEEKKEKERLRKDKCTGAARRPGPQSRAD